MPYNEQLTIDKVEPQVRQHQRAMNAARFAPPLTRLALKASEANKVYVFNVGPWAQCRLLGSLGQFHIPACPAGKAYSEPIVVPGIVREHYPISEVEMKALDDEGENVANQILGIGPHLAPQNSFVPYGVFVSHSDKPGKEEIAAANLALRETCRRLYQEAEVAYSLGPKHAEETIRPETHFVAARLIGHGEKDTLWMKNSAMPAETKDCPGCGTPAKVGIVVCPNCKFILLHDLYKASDYAK